LNLIQILLCAKSTFQHSWNMVLKKCLSRLAENQFEIPNRKILYIAQCLLCNLLVFFSTLTRVAATENWHNNRITYLESKKNKINYWVQSAFCSFQSLKDSKFIIASQLFYTKIFAKRGEEHHRLCCVHIVIEREFILFMHLAYTNII
jgi:hypothetical protein